LVIRKPEKILTAQMLVCGLAKGGRSLYFSAQSIRLAILLLLLMISLESRPSLAADGILVDDFEHGLAPAWEEKVFVGRTSYQVAVCESGHCLNARSRNAASGLVYPLELQPQAYPILHWRWKVADTIPGGDARGKATDDYAARIYVIFPHWFFPLTRTINYIWANQLPQEVSIVSSYTSNSIMLAVRSGREHRGEWLEERRDVLADYRNLFGAEPGTIGAIAIMTDTDNTGQTAEAWYDDISFSAK
jgi:Protein of unknown function (DUF3047)